MGRPKPGEKGGGGGGGPTKVRFNERTLRKILEDSGNLGKEGSLMGPNGPRPVWRGCGEQIGNLALSEKEVRGGKGIFSLMGYKYK